jgi:hypothetical protein
MLERGKRKGSIIESFVSIIYILLYYGNQRESESEERDEREEREERDVR